MKETSLNENEEISQVVCWISCLLLPTYTVAKLSTMTQDAMVYKVSSCFFFFYGSFFFQLELGLTPFTRILGVSCPFTENSRTYNAMLCVILLRILMRAVVGPTLPCMLPFH